MPNISSATSFFPKSYENTVPMTLGGSVLAGAATVPVNGMTNYTDGDVIAFVVDGATPALKQVFTGTKSGSNIINAVWTEFPTGGVNVPHAAGATVIDYVSATHWDLVQKGITSSLNQDGSLKTTAVQTALNITGGAAGGWTPTGFAPSAVAALGNRSYNLTFAAADLTATVSAGMRLRTTRTVAAPTQCTSLNGSTQYYSKTSPAGMTFTNNFVVSGWIKLSSYAEGVIASRYNGTSGWRLEVSSAGQILFQGYNAGAANYSLVTSYQSVPLNKWVHIAAQLDMATFTATTTTSYIMIDGVDVPVTVSRGGTNPTALIQAGNLEIGSWNGGLLPFSGKIAQVAIYSAKVTQATILASMHQTLAGTETSLISAYSFNNSINDLNANANNLTANGSAVATNADSPFGGQADGTISSTLDYAIVTKTAFSTNTTLTVQVPEGCTIPTSGGVSAVSYATVKAPYQLPVQRRKWQIETIKKASESISTGTGGGFVASNHTITMPVGSWSLIHEGFYAQNNSSTGNADFQFRLSGASAGALSDSTSETYLYSATNTDYGTTVHRESWLELSAQEVYTLQSAATAGAGTTTTKINGGASPCVLRAELALL